VWSSSDKFYSTSYSRTPNIQDSTPKIERRAASHSSQCSLFVRFANSAAIGCRKSRRALEKL